MDSLESSILGYICISVGIILLVIKILSLNNEKLYNKFKNTEFNDAAFWASSVGLILLGLKLIFTNDQFL